MATLAAYRQTAKIAQVVMLKLRSTAFSHRPVVWLMWLALLVPIAQAVAMCHVLSHAYLTEIGEADGKPALHQTQCDLCVTAAAVIGGATPGNPPNLQHSAALYEVPTPVSSGLWFARTAPPYQSRAPPIALR